MRRHRRLLAPAVWMALVLGAHAANAVDSSLSAPLCVMTYNLRFASPSPPNAWPQRRPAMVELIQNIAPDVIGTQEGVYSQLKELAADLPAFDWIGLGREGGSRGEFMAVFYRKERLEPLEFDHFWLSDTPEMMNSASWGNRYRRMVTWVRFRDRTSETVFLVFNTHFDHEVQRAREQSAALVRRRVDTLGTGLPVFLIGDFNAAAGTNRAYSILTSDGFFSDAWLAAPQRRGEGLGTFNGFEAAVPDGPRIDWILTRGPVTVDRAEMFTFSKDGHFPSDHFPVAAVVRLPSAK